MCLGNVWVHTVDVLHQRQQSGINTTAPLFEKHEKDCENEAGKGDDMIPLESLTLEEDCDYHTEDGETDNLLNYFELH